MKEWMASDLAGLDILVVHIDGIHIVEDLVVDSSQPLNVLPFDAPSRKALLKSLRCAWSRMRLICLAIISRRA